MVMPYGSANLAGGINPDMPPLIQAPPAGNFSGNFAQDTAGIRSIAENYAAAFSKDPARRQQYQEQLAIEDAQKQQQLQQLREQQLHFMDQMTELAMNGGFVPSVQRMTQQASGSIDALLGQGTAAQWQQVLQAADLAYKSQPQAGFDLGPGQTHFDAQGNPIASVAPKSDLLSPEAEAQYKRLHPQQPQQPRAPTDLETLNQWLKSGDPDLVAAARSKLGMDKGGPTPSDVSSIRGQYLQQSKDYQTVRQNYQVITSAENTGAGDIARVFGFMKLLDPSSTVREGEQASAQNAAGVPAAIRAQYNKLIGGGTLDEQARTEIRSQSDKLYKAYEGRQKVTEKQFSDIATSSGMDPKQVVLEQTPENQAMGSFDTMTPEQLTTVDVTKLNAEQLDQYMAALSKATSKATGK